MAILLGWLMIFALVAPVPAGASPANESDFVGRINATRASVGLPPLAVDAQLTSLARGWAVQMRDGVCGEGAHICHAPSLSSGVSHSWQKLGENVGTGPSVGDVMPAFIASPSHYANIVDPSFTHIGVGVVWDGNRLYTTHRFMAVQAPAPTTTTTVAPTTTTAAPTTTTAAPTTTTTAPTTTTAAPPVTSPSAGAPTTDSSIPPTGALAAPLRSTSPSAQLPPPALPRTTPRPDDLGIGDQDSTSDDADVTRDNVVPISPRTDLEFREERADVLVDALTRIS